MAIFTLQIGGALVKDLLNWDAIVRLAEIAGPVGLVVVAIMLGMFFIVKTKGWSGFGDQTKMIASSRIDGIDLALRSIDKRLTDVEHDLEDRPTREDIQKIDQKLNEIEKNQVRQEEKHIALAAIAGKTNEGVLRIEEFLYDLAKLSTKEKGGK